MANRSSSRSLAPWHPLVYSGDFVAEQTNTARLGKKGVASATLRCGVVTYMAGITLRCGIVTYRCGVVTYLAGITLRCGVVTYLAGITRVVTYMAGITLRGGVVTYMAGTDDRNDPAGW